MRVRSLSLLGTFFRFTATTFASIFVYSSSLASHRIEDAEVKDIDGTPCFSIPSNHETRDGIPLYAILVSDARASQPKSLPEEFWDVEIRPLGDAIPIFPKQCIPYGKDLPTSEQILLKPLEPLRVYTVTLFARPKKTNIVGYSAEFCLIPTNQGALKVHVLSRDGTPDSERFRACAPR